MGTPIMKIDRNLQNEILGACRRCIHIVKYMGMIAIHLI